MTTNTTRFENTQITFNHQYYIAILLKSKWISSICGCHWMYRIWIGFLIKFLFDVPLWNTLPYTHVPNTDSIRTTHNICIKCQSNRKIWMKYKLSSSWHSCFHKHFNANSNIFLWKKSFSFSKYIFKWFYNWIRFWVIINSSRNCLCDTNLLREKKTKRTKLSIPMFFFCSIWKMSYPQIALFCRKMHIAHYLFNYIYHLFFAGEIITVSSIN